jgi:hypothetical protein
LIFLNFKCDVILLWLSSDFHTTGIISVNYSACLSCCPRFCADENAFLLTAPFCQEDLSG